MAEFGMWGAEQAGERVAEQDRFSNAHKAASTLHLLAQNELIPAQKSQAEAHARLYGAQAAEKEAEVRTQEKVSAALSGMSMGEGTADPSDTLDRIGMLQVQSGALKAGGETLSRAASIRARDARAMNQAAATALSELRAAGETLKMTGGIAGSIRDQASLDQARILGAANGLDFSQIPQDYASAAPILAQLAEASMTRAQQVAGRAREIEAEARRTSEADQRRTRSSTRVVNEARVRDIESRIDARGKNLGKPVGSANTQEVRQATAFIQQQTGGAKFDPLELTAGAADLANTARGLMKRNPGLDFGQAMGQAFNAEDWALDKGLTGLGKPTAKRSGKSPRSALPAPKALKDYVTGTWYQTPRGIGKWTGTGFIKPDIPTTPLAADDDDDEDEE